MTSTFSDRVIEIISGIPRGKVMTYGQIAAAAGNPRGARQVVRILHVFSDKKDLPWFRVVNRQGKISLPSGYGYELQKSLLEDEGAEFGPDDRIDLNIARYSPV